MDEERKAWEKQFWSNFGVPELLRILAAFMGCIFLGIISFMLTRSQWAYWPFVLLPVVFPFVSRVCGPAYRVLRFILGNPNLPAEPMPRSKVKTPRQPLPKWWSLIHGIWSLILALATLYFAIRFFLK